MPNPRLRTLKVGTRTLGDAREDKYILVLDRLPPEARREGPTNPDYPMLSAPFEVDLPDADTLDTLTDGLTVDQADKVHEYAHQLATQYRMDNNRLARLAAPEDDH